MTILDKYFTVIINCITLLSQISVSLTDNETTLSRISKCCPLGEYFVLKDDSNVRECVKQPLYFHNDIRRYNSYLKEFQITFHNPCEGIEGVAYDIRPKDLVAIDEDGSLLISSHSGATVQLFDYWCLELEADRRVLIAYTCENKPYISKSYATNQNAKTLALIVLLVLFVTSLILIVSIYVLRCEDSVLGRFFTGTPMAPFVPR